MLIIVAIVGDADMTNSEPIIQADYSGGLIDDRSVSKSKMPPNCLRKAINILFDRPRGGLTQRSGSTLVGDAAVSAGNTILGLHNFRSSTVANSKLLAVAGSSIFRLVGTTWSSSTGVTSGLKTRFLTYLDTVVFMNGTDASKSSTDGTTFVATGGNLDVANFPRAKFATILNTRVLTGGDPSNPDTISLSSLASSSGAISWTSGNKTVQVDPNDGAGGLTGVVSNGRVALLFKERALFRFNDSELQRVGSIGTPSYESIVTDNTGTTFFFGQGANGIGFYMTQGGVPVLISRTIIRYVEAISPSFYANVSANTDSNKVEWSIGSITIDDNTYTNASLVYFIGDQTWSVFSRDDRFRVSTQFITSTGALTIVSGDTDGAVQTIDSGTTDNGAPIHSEGELSPLTFGSRGPIKTLKQVVAMCEHFQGLNLAMKADQGEFKQIGALDKENKFFSDLPTLRGHEFFPKITSSNSGTPWEFSGLEFPPEGVVFDGYQK